MNTKTDPVTLDVRGLKCPLLFVKTKQSLKLLTADQRLKVLITDLSGIKDIQRYLDKNRYRYTMTATKTATKVETVEFCIWGLRQNV